MGRSSPIIYPSSPASPGRPKRSRPDDDDDTPGPTTTAVADHGITGGFLIDSDSDTDVTEPVAKKRMLHVLSIPGVEDSISALDLAGKETGGDRMGHILPIRGQVEEEFEGYMVNPTSQESEHMPIFEASLFQDSHKTYVMKSCSGRTSVIRQRTKTAAVPYEELVAARSKTKVGHATRSYYGIAIHKLVQNAQAELEAQKILAEQAAKKAEDEAAEAHLKSIDSMLVDSVEANGVDSSRKPKKHSLWTEKYRARKFMDLCGDDTTNRHVLRWIKSWDPIVFPGSRPQKRLDVITAPGNATADDDDERQHRKILMLTGPPGLGKTTLAHVCARQAGYDVLEINASDDRSRDIVRGRIRTSLGTETVKTVMNTRARADRKARVARPLCVIVDEVDGVTSGAGTSGDGGFIRSLMDLMMLDQKNAKGASAAGATGKGKKSRDDFRQMRPLVLICNDIYALALRPLRMSNLAEIIHVGKPSVDHVVNRLLAVFMKEGITCERDAARKLCEAAWGMASGIEARRGVESAIEGDLRGVMVVSQWVATRFQAQSLSEGNRFLSRVWLEKHILKELQNGNGGGRGTGRGSVRDIVTRVFQEGAGFPKPALGSNSEQRVFMSEQPMANLGFAEHHKKHGIAQLQHMIDTSGDHDRIMSEIFTEYPNREYTDDSALGKPNEAYEWMHFLDTCSSRLFREQDWELAPYLTQPILACHSLFAAPIRQATTNSRWRGGDDDDDEKNVPIAFSGPKGAFQMVEVEKQNRAILQAIQAELPARLLRAFRNPEDIATEFLPYLARLVAPDVKPVIIHGGGDQRSTASVRKDSEKKMVKRAAETLADVGVKLVKGRVEGEMMRGPQWVYRLEPDLDELSLYKTLTEKSTLSQPPTRYAIRQVLDQELRLVHRARETAARQARFASGGDGEYEFDKGVSTGGADGGDVPASQIVPVKVRKDFFGRVVAEPVRVEREVQDIDTAKVNVWIRFHEGLNNAVRKPVTVRDFMRGM